MKYVDSFSFDYYKKYKQGNEENEVSLSISEAYKYCAETLTLAQIIFFANKHFKKSMPQLIKYIDEIIQSVISCLAMSLDRRGILIDYDNATYINSLKEADIAFDNLIEKLNYITQPELEKEFSKINRALFGLLLYIKKRKNKFEYKIPENLLKSLAESKV